MNRLHLECLFVAFMGVFIFSVAWGISAYMKRSKFEVGDCVLWVYENEFRKSLHYMQIKKVGSEYYLVDRFSEDLNRIYSKNDTELKHWVNGRYDKIDSRFCHPH